jgi:hypothetical protein
MDLREREWGDKFSSAHVTQDRDNWRTVVNTMNLGVPKKGTYIFE